MKALHRAALVRAYRTLAQGLGGSAVATALLALITDGETARVGLIAALGTTLVAALTSFWQGVAAGLPEVDLAEALVIADQEHEVDLTNALEGNLPAEE